MQSEKEAAASAPTRPALTRKDTQKKHTSSTRYPFWFGGSASSCAAVVTHPLDLVKVRYDDHARDCILIGRIANIIFFTA